jgi:hypothetical protein
MKSKYVGAIQFTKFINKPICVTADGYGYQTLCGFLLKDYKGKHKTYEYPTCERCLEIIKNIKKYY